MLHALMQRATVSVSVVGALPKPLYADGSNEFDPGGQSLSAKRGAGFSTFQV